MEIQKGDLDNAAVVALLREHLAAMEPTAPPESRHALDLNGLRGPDITFWAMWDGDLLAGVGAMKQLTPTHAEIKSMKTAPGFLRKGVASRLLRHIIDDATARGYMQLSLETGSMPFFEPARKLYERFGFQACPPFGSYVTDPNSVFMTKYLELEGSDTTRRFG